MFEKFDRKNNQTISMWLESLSLNNIYLLQNKRVFQDFDWNCIIQEHEI